MRALLVLLGLQFALAVPVAAEMIEEVIVTGAWVESARPAQRIVRRGDFLLLRVDIVNDAREAAQRRDEIHETLLGAVRAAAEDPRIELSSVSDGGFVVPLRASNHRIELTAGNRPDTSRASFRVKVGLDADATDGEALVLALRRFVEELDMVGRTLVDVDGDVEISIVDPGQYRSAVIELMARDVREVTDALGDDYRVVLSGIDRPVSWARLGSLDVAIYIPYEYMVLPTSVSSVNLFPEY